MRLRVRLFASLAERAGAPELLLDLPEGTRAGALWDEVQRRVPGLAGAPRPRVAVNLAVAAAERVLESGDEVALLPPVSGG